MRILKKQNVPHVKKSEGITVDYYLLPEYEVHYNEQAPLTAQIWHHHEKIWETLFIIEGELAVSWEENEEIKTQIVKQGDLIEAEHNPHSFTNQTDKVVKFLVIKQILSGEDKKELFKTDKIIDSQLNNITS